MERCAADGFRKNEVAVGMLPLELPARRSTSARPCRPRSRLARFLSAHRASSIEFETLNVPPEMRPALSVLAGRVRGGTRAQ